MRTGVDRVGVAVLATLAALTPLAAGACGKELDVSKPEEAIAHEVEQVYSVQVDEVMCPDDIDVERGSTFDCVVALADDRLTANVTQTDSEGGLTFELAERILTPRTVAAAIREQFNATSVDCGERTYWVSRPGRTFTCRAKDDAGGDAQIEVTIRDTRGNIDLDFAE